MQSDDAPEGLNPSQRLHLLSSSQHADKLLADVESILTASKSKSAFHKYKNPLAPAQMKVVEDYISRIRTQMVRVLESQGIALPEPRFESIHSIRVTLAFVRTAYQECTPERMRGYGELPDNKVRELNGLVDEMESAIEKLDAYLSQGWGQDLEARLERLANRGAKVGLLKNLERIINEHGLVEFRPTLSMILDRMESENFEIALFGRVSSGKSSLLNHIVRKDILPVGVTPITAVPTRLAYGDTPRLSVWYADRGLEQTDLARLPEFVSEHHNPGNYKHVTRILAELPSDRLRDGVVLVDTPGLGSLATSGAAETLAYLPRCDVGIVLVDAGSTLTGDDIGTIRTLYEAGIPASVLLSKADLLSAEDRARSIAYISQQIQSQLRLSVSIHAASVEEEHSFLLEAWLKDKLLPLYQRHRQLAQESLSRKTGSLHEGVVTALKLRRDRAGVAADLVRGREPIQPDQIDRALREATGRIAEVRQLCCETARALRDQGDRSLVKSAKALSTAWHRDSGVSPAAIVGAELARFAAEQAQPLSGALQDLAVQLSRTLESAAERLGYQRAKDEHDLSSAINEMPRLDPGGLRIALRPGLLEKVSRRLSERRIHRILRRQIGPQVEEAFLSAGKLLDSWSRRTLAELQLRFETYADRYRSHVNRMIAREPVSGADRAAVVRDLISLGEAEGEVKVDLVSAP
jgi:GTP-binding protein EngB required for normal cell division